MSPQYCNNPNQQPHLRVFRLDVERRVVTWSSPSKGAAKTTIHIEDIQEVRRGQRTARYDGGSCVAPTDTPADS